MVNFYSKFIANDSQANVSHVASEFCTFTTEYLKYTQTSYHKNVFSLL